MTDETIGRVSDFGDQIRACIKAAETAHKAEKDPFLTAGRVVDAWLGTISGPLAQLHERVLARKTAFLRAKEDAERKRLEEEAARLAGEAKALAAAGDKEQAREVRAEAADLRTEALTASAADLVRLTPAWEAWRRW